MNARLSDAEFVKNEWPLLCTCVSPSATEDSVRIGLTKTFHWDVLLELAERHSVQGILAKRLEGLEFAGMPTEARTKLQSRMRAQHLFTLSMTAELFHVLDDFAAAGLEAIVVKGPVTSLVAYADSSMRGYGDVDLLLRQKDIARANQRMQALGFEAKVRDSAIEVGKVPGEYVFMRPSTSRMVEIHTERTFRYYPNGVPIGDMFRRKRLITLEGHKVAALSLPDELVFHCVHGAKDFWERLMWICDIAALSKNHPEIDWVETQHIASASGAARMLNVGMLLGQRVLRAPIPPAIVPSIERDRISDAVCDAIEAWLPLGGGGPPSLRQRALYRARIGGGGIAGMAYLLRLSLSPTEEDWELGTQQSPSRFWDAVRRPFRLFRKYGSEN